MDVEFFRRYALNYTTGIKGTAIPVVFFIVVFGTLFGNINIFENSEWTSKWYWLYAIVPVCGLLSLFYGSDKSVTVNSVIFSLAILFVYCFIRIIIGISSVPSFAFFILLFLIYFLSFKIVNNKTFDGCSVSIMCAAILLALYGCIESMGCLAGRNLFKISGIFDNPAGYASALTISLPFVLYFTFSDRRYVRWLALIAFILIFLTIILSASRAAFLAVVILILLYVVRQHNSLLKKISILKKLLCLGIFIAVLCGLYFLKKDSADGRILIWKCTWEMIKEKPLSGHGYKSMESRYMLYQADYFERNPESKFLLLADNVKHPFNEFLLLIVELGLVAFALLIVFSVNFLRLYLKNQNDRSFTLFTALLMMGVLSFFSYPFKYPYTWLIVGFCIGSFIALTRQGNERLIKCGIFKYIFILQTIILLSYTICMIYSEYKWHDIAHRIKVDTSDTLVSEYDKLYFFLNANAYFIYNYAVKLNQVGAFDKSLKMVFECESLLNDYDIQMLKADNYKQIGDFYRAKDCYVLASRMCPNRFIPLYELVNIYDSINRPDLAIELALEIIEKPVKIPSKVISMIKQRMKQRIDTCMVEIDRKR